MNLKPLIQTQIGAILLSLWTILSGILAIFGEKLLPLYKLQTIPTVIWVETVSILLLAVLALLAYLRVDKRLKLKYGIYWDKNRNPHCPSCKKPLQLGIYSSYECITCNKNNIRPFDKSGRNLPIEIVHRLLRGENVTDNEIENIHNAHKPEPMTYCTTVKMREPHP